MKKDLLKIHVEVLKQPSGGKAHPFSATLSQDSHQHAPRSGAEDLGGTVFYWLGSHENGQKSLIDFTLKKNEILDFICLLHIFTPSMGEMLFTTKSARL